MKKRYLISDCLGQFVCITKQKPSKKDLREGAFTVVKIPYSKDPVEALKEAPNYKKLKETARDAKLLERIDVIFSKSHRIKNACEKHGCIYICDLLEHRKDLTTILGIAEASADQMAEILATAKIELVSMKKEKRENLKNLARLMNPKKERELKKS